MITRKTEILVHTTAPSRTSDDVNYRILAASYLSFEPAGRTTPGPLGHHAQHGLEHMPLPATQESTTSNLGLAAFESPDLSFGSVAHNLQSPDLRRTGDREVTSPQSSWRAPPSVVADSNPDNNISIARYCSPTRILEHYLQGFDSSQSCPSQGLAQDAGRVITAATGRDVTSITCSESGTSSQLGAFSVERGSSQQVTSFRPGSAPQRKLVPGRESLTNASVIPQSQFFPRSEAPRPEVPVPSPSEAQVIPSSIATEQSLPPHGVGNAVSGGEAVISSSGPLFCFAQTGSASTAVESPSSRADSEPPPPAKRQRRLLTHDNSISLARSSSDIGPRQDTLKSNQLNRRQRALQTPDGLEIHSPEPPVGCEDMDISAILTENVEKLAKSLGIQKRFKPTEQKRDLRPFERGYWLVDCSAWPEHLKEEAWGFLGNYVGNGVAGWGVWCRRDEKFSWIRLYCWGCVVGYMYLLLYLCSRRRVNYTGGSWIGGDGEVIIIMEPKYI